MSLFWSLSWIGFLISTSNHISSFRSIIFFFFNFPPISRHNRLSNILNKNFQSHFISFFLLKSSTHIIPIMSLIHITLFALTIPLTCDFFSFKKKYLSFLKGTHWSVSQNFNIWSFHQSKKFFSSPILRIHPINPQAWYIFPLFELNSIMNNSSFFLFLFNSKFRLFKFILYLILGLFNNFFVIRYLGDY